MTQTQPTHAVYCKAGTVRHFVTDGTQQDCIDFCNDHKWEFDYNGGLVWDLTIEEIVNVSSDPKDIVLGSRTSELKMEQTTFTEAMAILEQFEVTDYAIEMADSKNQLIKLADFIQDCIEDGTDDSAHDLINIYLRAVAEERDYNDHFADSDPYDSRNDEIEDYQAMRRYESCR